MSLEVMTPLLANFMYLHCNLTPNGRAPSHCCLRAPGSINPKDLVCKIRCTIHKMHNGAQIPGLPYHLAEYCSSQLAKATVLELLIFIGGSVVTILGLMVSRSSLINRKGFRGSSTPQAILGCNFPSNQRLLHSLAHLLLNLQLLEAT